jgi:hypothetical protein
MQAKGAEEDFSGPADSLKTRAASARREGLPPELCENVSAHDARMDSRHPGVTFPYRSAKLLAYEARNCSRIRPGGRCKKHDHRYEILHRV